MVLMSVLEKARNFVWNKLFVFSTFLDNTLSVGLQVVDEVCSVTVLCGADTAQKDTLHWICNKLSSLSLNLKYFHRE